MGQHKYRFSAEQYFPIPIEKLVFGKKRLFPLFIYFEKNQHLVLRYWPGEGIEPDEREHYSTKGLKSFWCPTEFLKAYEEYLNSPQTVDQRNAPTENLQVDARSQEAKVAIDVLSSSDFSEDEKKKVLGYISKEMMATFSLSDDKNPEAVKKILGKCKQFAEDIIKVALKAYKDKSIFEEILELQKNTDIEHSTAVSTLSVMFALGLGYTDMELLADISLGALLHDLGFVEIDPSLLVMPRNTFTEDQIKGYESHVVSTVKLLEDNGLTLNERVKSIIQQHHEKYNGSGFPQKLKGVGISEAAQVVGLADLLDDLMKGQVDGEAKSPSQAIELLKKIQYEKDEPVYFSPELFLTVIQLIDRKPESN